MAVLKNRAKMSTSTTGTGTITLGSAEDGYQTFADAGVANADVVRYVIEDGNNWEIGTGTYTATGTTLSRTVSESSNSDAAINLSGSATVFIGATAEDVFQGELFAENYDGTSTLPSATGTNSIAIGVDAISTGTRSVVIGKGNAAGQDSFVAAGSTNTSTYGALLSHGIAMGANARAESYHSIAIGENTRCRSERSAAIGNYATLGTSAGGSIALMGTVNNFADNAVALGKGSVAGSGGDTTALGRNSMAQGGFSVALAESRTGGNRAFAAAIANNTSSYGANGTSSIVMGRLSKASGADSFAIGDNNIVANESAFALGNTNNVTGSTGFALGESHTVSGSYSASIGGYGSTATQTYAMTFGPYAKADVQNAFIFGSKGWFSAGSAQGGMYILYADTTDATAEALTTTNSTAGSTNQIVAASDTCITFDGTITAMQNGAQAYASWKIEGLLVNDGGTTTLANSATTVISNADGWGMALSADNTNNALAITCTGEASHNIRWVANIRTTEVTYA